LIPEKTSNDGEIRGKSGANAKLEKGGNEREEGDTEETRTLYYLTGVPSFPKQL